MSGYRDTGSLRVASTILPDALRASGKRCCAGVGISLAMGLVSLYALPAKADDAGITLEVTASAEYDDNVTLVSDPDGERRSDVVFRIAPHVGFELPLRDHRLSFSLDADYRQGTDTEIDDLNLTGAAGVDLKFRNGLQLNLSESYTQTTFDQELQAETGTPDGDRTDLTIRAVYVPVDRFQVAATYEQQRQDFDESGDVSASDRDVDTLTASITVPLTRSIVATAGYTTEDLVSPQRPDRDYTQDAYTVMARWQGPSRFVVWLELGEETIDFALPGETDFDDTTARIGAEVKLTDSLDGQLAAGRGGFGETVYDGRFSYQSDTDRQASLTFSHGTEPSYSFVFQSRVVQTSRVDLSFSNRLGERIALTLGAGYQAQESALDREERDDEVWDARLAVDYPVQEWFRLGFSYRYARRTSSLESFDFANNRIGIFGRFTR